MTNRIVFNSQIIDEGELLPLVTRQIVTDEWDAELTGDEPGSRITYVEKWKGQDLSMSHAEKVWMDEPDACGVYSIYMAFMGAFGQVPSILEKL